MKPLETIATLWPDMPHYGYFARDSRLDGIRLNTAMATKEELPGIIDTALRLSPGKDLYFDIKGRQLRVESVSPRKDHLEITLNHPIEVDTPTPVIFKAGADSALLRSVEDGGKRLVFYGGPAYNIRDGESLQIRHPSMSVQGDLFTPREMEFLDMAKKGGMTKYMLSYTGSLAELEELRDIVGPEAEIVAKIETQKGMDFVKNEYTNQPWLHLLTARGDLFVEVDKPHDVVRATKELVQADPDAIVGSRLLLSLTEESVPSCADLTELAWLKEAGYYRFMFCDGLCLQKEPLDRAIAVLQATYKEFDGKRDEGGFGEIVPGVWDYFPSKNTLAATRWSALKSMYEGG